MVRAGPQRHRIMMTMKMMMMTISVLTHYCSGKKIENNEMGGACNEYGERGVYRALVGKPEGK
jgi:hypothetical protein